MTAGLTTTREETGLRSVIHWLAQDRNVTLFVNFRRAKAALPDWLSDEDDLYAEAPQEVREEHSLHAVGERDLDELWKLAESLKDRNACVWVFPKLEREELLKGLKLYLAWYARPSALKVQLEQGSKELAKGLLTGVHAIALQVPGDERLFVFSTPEIVGEWKAAGLSWALGDDPRIVVCERSVE